LVVGRCTRYIRTNEVYEASAGHVEMHWLMKRPRFDPALPGTRIMGKLALLFFYHSFCHCVFACCIVCYWFAYYSGGHIWIGIRLIF